MHKKGDLPSLSFLIGVLIAIMIVVPLSVAFVKFMWFSSEKDTCFNELVEAVSGGSVFCPPSDSVVIGFDAVQQAGLIYWAGEFVEVQRPGACVEGAACLCLYSKKMFVKPLQEKGELFPVKECKELQGAETISGSSVSFEHIVIKQGYDFFYANPQIYVTYNVTRKGDAVMFCAADKCVFDEPKQVLGELKQLYDRCGLYKGDCSCGKVDLKRLGKNHIDVSKGNVLAAESRLGGLIAPGSVLDKLIKKLTPSEDVYALLFYKSAYSEDPVPGTHTYLMLGAGEVCYYEDGEFEDGSYKLEPEKENVYLIRHEGKVCFSEEPLYKSCSA